MPRAASCRQTCRRLRVGERLTPADSPILMIGMTSDTMPPGDVYDVAASILQQKLAQMKGVGQVSVGGGALPAVRVDCESNAVEYFWTRLEDIRTMLATRMRIGRRAISTISTRLVDQHHRSASAGRAIQAAGSRIQNGAAVKLSDVATVTDSVEDIRNIGFVNGKQGDDAGHFPAARGQYHRDGGPRAAELPQLRAEVPAAMHLQVILDAPRRFAGR